MATEVNVGRDDRRDAADQLLALEARIMEAIAARDRVTLGPLLTDGFVLQVPGAADVGREPFLEAIASVPGEIQSIRGEGTRASLVGEVGVVTGVQVATVRLAENGRVVTSRGAYTDVFERVNGEWRLALAFSVDLPPQSGDE